MAIDTNGRDQPLRTQSQVEEGREDMDQQEMSSLLAVSLPLQKGMLQMRQSKLSWSLLGGQESAK